MLISHKNRFVFLHNPKVAGTSFRNMLTKNFECEDHRFNALVDGFCQDQAHLRVDQWPRQLWDLYTEGYYFFGIVRNPRDRFMSSMSEFWHQHRDMAKLLNVSREQLLSVMLTPNSINYDVRFIHFTEQWRFFDYDLVVDPTRASNLDIDVFRFEHLSEWIESPSFLKKLGATGPLQIQNDRPSYFREELTDEVLERMIPFLYHEDYERFWYNPRRLLSFLNHTHSHKLEFVHRYPRMVNQNDLNDREANALARKKPQIQSMALREFKKFAEKATETRRANKEKNA